MVKIFYFNRKGKKKFYGDNICKRFSAVDQKILMKIFLMKMVIKLVFYILKILNYETQKIFIYLIPIDRCQ